ncbi:MAG: hypothetical protein O8C67_15655 [Candidatus Methanoperedens sp.]|nr:hypothetical protein [Candidatus Methanoperedens sp.]
MTASERRLIFRRSTLILDGYDYSEHDFMGHDDHDPDQGGFALNKNRGQIILGSASRGGWIPVIFVPGYQIIDWICPACNRIIYFTNGSKCPHCALPVKEYPPAKVIAEDPQFIRQKYYNLHKWVNNNYQDE